MSPKNNLEQREARELAKAEGTNYTTALRKIRQDKAASDPAAQESAEWEKAAEQERWRGIWESAFMTVGYSAPPALIQTEEFPPREEWASDAPYRPVVRAHTFRLPQGSPFSRYADCGSKLAAYFGADACPVTPVGMVGADGKETPGTVGNVAFRVWQTDANCATADPLDPNLDRWLRQFLVLAFVMPRLSAVEGIGACVFESCGMLSHASMQDRNITIRLKPRPGVFVEQFLRRLDAIREVLGVKWAHAEADAAVVNPMVTGTTIALHVGDGPRPGGEEPYLTVTGYRGSGKITNLYGAFARERLTDHLTFFDHESLAAIDRSPLSSPHLLVVGSPGSGKSALVEGIIQRAAMETVTFKSEPSDPVGSLEAFCDEVELLVRRDPSRALVAVDGLDPLLLEVGAPDEDRSDREREVVSRALRLIALIAREGRNAGIYLLAATQTPSHSSPLQRAMDFDTAVLTLAGPHPTVEGRRAEAAAASGKRPFRVQLAGDSSRAWTGLV